MNLELFKKSKQIYLNQHPELQTYPHVGRVSAEFKLRYSLLTSEGVKDSILLQNIVKQSTSEKLPKVGDWVTFAHSDGEEKVIIEKVLPRDSFLTRKSAGKDEAPQGIVANIDLAYIVFGLDKPINLGALERYVLLITSSDIPIEIILNKSDTKTSKQIETILETVRHNFPNHHVQATTINDPSTFQVTAEKGGTVVLLGPSGSGKSSLINSLRGEKSQATGEVREKDKRGRHTTTSRQMFELDDSVYIIDTPGTRELGLSMDENTHSGSFEDIEELSRQCKFSKCDHNKTEGCALLEAVDKGNLDSRRLKTFLKLKNESINRIKGNWKGSTNRKSYIKTRR